jgi:hypothetical protein
VVFQDNSGKWVSNRIYTGCRVWFGKVVTTTDDAVVLELRNGCTTEIYPSQTVDRLDKKNEGSDKGIMVRMWLENGVPVATEKGRTALACTF